MITNFILAQSTDLPAVPSDLLKWVIVILVCIVLVTCAIIVAWTSLQSKKTKLDDNPPIEVRKSPKRFNHELAEQRHADHERRLLALESWRGSLIEKLDSDKNEIMEAGQQREDNIRAHVDSVRRELDLKIDQVPDRLIATLKNTGAI